MKKAEYTPLADAKSIVGTEELWVAIEEPSWDNTLRNGAWNDALYGYAVGVPPSSIKVSTLPRQLKKGWVYRPLKSYKDFANRGIACVKGL